MGFLYQRTASSPTFMQDLVGGWFAGKHLPLWCCAALRCVPLCAIVLS